MKNIAKLCALILAGMTLGCSRQSDPELYPVCVEIKWGFVNAKGEYVIMPFFDDVSCFSCGLARVVDKGKVGYVNTKGDFVIPATYLSGTSFTEDKAFVTLVGESPICIDKLGNVLFKLENAEYANCFSEGLARIVTTDNKTGFINNVGEYVIEPKFEDAKDFQEDLAMVKLGGKWGSIDKNGNIVIEPQYDDCKSFSEGFAGVRIGSEWGFVDKSGNPVIVAKYADVSEFSEGLAAVSINGRYGYINKKGEFIINPKYDIASSFANGYATVGKWIGDDDYACVIDKKGKELCDNYNSVGVFGEAIFYQETYRSKYGIKNKKWEVIAEPQFDMVDPKKLEVLVRSNKYDAKPFLDYFFSHFGSCADCGLSKNITLSEARAKFQLEFHRYPGDYIIYFRKAKGPFINGIAMKTMHFYFDRNNRDRWDCLSKSVYYSEIQENIYSKIPAIENSLAHAIENITGDQFTIQDNEYVMRKSEQHLGYKIYCEYGGKLCLEVEY